MDTDREKAMALSQSSKPEPTWFFERGDGKIFACGEQEAWNLMKNKTEWMRRDFKLVGQSDGQTYFETLKNSKAEAREMLEKKKALQTDLARYVETENDLRFKQLKDDDDEMVKRVLEKIANINKQIVEIDEKLASFNTLMVEKAFNLELEKAKISQALPKNNDIVTPQEHERSRILNQLGK